MQQIETQRNANNRRPGDRHERAEQSERTGERFGTATEGAYASSPLATLAPLRAYERSLQGVERSLDRLLAEPWAPNALRSPIVSGVTVQAGRDGQPSFRPFGNVTGPLEALGQGVREPVLTWSIDETTNQATFRCEVPGVAKANVEIDVVEDAVSICGQAEGQRYEANVSPGIRLDPGNATATYVDGVVLLTIGLAEGTSRRARRVPVA